jgi:hypothetical protein
MPPVFAGSLFRINRSWVQLGDPAPHGGAGLALLHTLDTRPSRGRYAPVYTTYMRSIIPGPGERSIGLWGRNWMGVREKVKGYLVGWRGWGFGGSLGIGIVVV